MWMGVGGGGSRGGGGGEGKVRIGFGELKKKKLNLYVNKIIACYLGDLRLILAVYVENLVWMNTTQE